MMGIKCVDAPKTTAEIEKEICSKIPRTACGWRPWAGKPGNMKDQIVCDTSWSGTCDSQGKAKSLCDQVKPLTVDGTTYVADSTQLNTWAYICAFNPQ